MAFSTGSSELHYGGSLGTLMFSSVARVFLFALLVSVKCNFSAPVKGLGLHHPLSGTITSGPLDQRGGLRSESRGGTFTSLSQTESHITDIGTQTEQTQQAPLNKNPNVWYLKMKVKSILLLRLEKGHCFSPLPAVPPRTNPVTYQKNDFTFHRSGCGGRECK